MWVTLIMDAVPSLITLAGVIVSVYFLNRHNRRMIEAKLEQIRLEFQQRQEEQDLAVSRLILPKCLEAMQSAFTYTMEINSLLAEDHSVLNLENKEIDSPEKLRGEIHYKLHAYRKWYDMHCMYLPKNVRGHFVTVINFAHRHYIDIAASQRTNRDVYNELHELVKTLQEDFDAFMKRYNLVDRLMEKEAR